MAACADAFLSVCRLNNEMDKLQNTFDIRRIANDFYRALINFFWGIHHYRARFQGCTASPEAERFISAELSFPEVFVL
jgi:hypothetical protein